MSRLKMYLSMEDNRDVVEDEHAVAVDIPAVEPVTDEDVYEADAHLEESQVERAEDERAESEDESIAEDIEDRIESLESISDIISHGLESHVFSPQFAAVVDHKLKPYQDMFGLESFDLGLENYNADNMEAYYTVALEATTETIYKLRHALDNVLAKGYDAINGTAAQARRTVASKSLIKKADALLEKLSGESASATHIVSLKGVGGKLTQDGSFPNNLVDAVKKDQKAVEFLLGKYVDSAIQRQVAMQKAVADGVKRVRASDGGAPTKDAEAFAKQGTVESSIPVPIREGKVLLGGVKLSIPDVEAGDSAAKTLVAMAKAGKVKFSKVDVKELPPTLTVKVSDLRALANAVKTYAVMIEKSGTSVGEALKKGLKNSQMQNVYAKREGDMLSKWFKKNPELQAMSTLTKRAPSVMLNVASKAFGHAEDVAKALLVLANRAADQKPNKKED